VGVQNMAGFSMIRWKGLAKVALVLSIFAGGYLLFFDKIITSTLVSVLETAADAKVNIKKTKLRFSPFGLRIEGLRIADADDPMKNLFQTGIISASMDLGYLLEGKYVVNQVQVTGLEFGTNRKTSGKRLKKKIEKKSSATSKSPKSAIQEKISKLSVDDVLDKNELETKKKKDAIDALIKQKQKDLKEITNTDSHKQKISVLKSELEAAMKIDIQSIEDIKQIEISIQTIKRIKKEISVIKTDLTNKQKKVFADISLIKKEINSLKAQGSKDYTSALSTLNLDTLKSGNINSTLLKAPLQDKLMKARDIWSRIQKAFPIQEKTKKEAIETGITVSFPSFAQPIPKLWIKTVALSGVIDGQVLTGKIKNISSDKNSLNKPTTFYIESINKQTPKQSFILIGESDLRNGSQKHTINFKRNHWPIKSMQLPSSITLQSGRTNTVGDIVIINKGIKGSIATTGSDIVFVSKEKTLLSRVVSDITTLKIKTDISGSLSKPKVSIHSDLDSKLKAASKSVADKEINKVKRELKQKINAQVSIAQKEALAQLSQINTSGLSKSLKSVTNLDTLADTAKQRAQSKIDNEKQRLKAEKDAKLAKAKEIAKAESLKLKAQLEAEKKKAQKKLKKDLENTLKNLW
jgi:uncharacterized protein (TIGR03545 family)